MTTEFRIQYHCPACGEMLSIKPEYAGKWVKCEYCDSLIEVPSLDISQQTKPPPIPIQPIEKRFGVYCEKCGAPMKKTSIRNKDNGGTLGCITFILFILSFVFWPLFLVTLLLLIHTIRNVLLPGEKHFWKCTRCGYFYECM